MLSAWFVLLNSVYLYCEHCNVEECRANLHAFIGIARAESLSLVRGREREGNLFFGQRRTGDLIRNEPILSLIQVVCFFAYCTPY